MPDGSMELIINLRDEPRHIFDPITHRPLRDYRSSWFSGPHSRFIVIDTAPNSSMIGAHFKPGGASAFLNLPASALRNEVVELNRLWNGEAADLREQLLFASTPDKKLSLLEAALLRRVRPRRHPAVAYALKRFSKAPLEITIAKVADEVGLSSRHFIQHFTDEVGLGPKMFCRVQRFQHVLGDVGRARPVVWADVAAGGGYYDQAHFIHDFQEFCGMTPSRFTEQTMEYPNFVPICA